MDTSYRSMIEQLVKLLEVCPPTSDTDWVVRRMELLAGVRTMLKAAGNSNLLAHARRELSAIGYAPVEGIQEDGPNLWIQQNIIELLEVFTTQGHSGSSAPYCIGLFTKLASFEPLGPLTGEDSEWMEVSEGTWQNLRCSHVFKDADGRAYNSAGRVFREPSGACFTSRDSRVYVEFPYTPVTEYVDVEESQ
jgi:hypothetical protein